MKQDILELQKTVWQYYDRHGRELPWRVPEPDGRFDPYKILVSEVMLQQTQVPRVIPKYRSFLAKFPDIKNLAKVPLSDVLSEWSGLGYNRRAKFLHEAAKKMVNAPEPWTLQDLITCKGIGPNTAAAVLVYTYNQPLAFIETNIRTVFIHHFFKEKIDVHDKDILAVVERSLPVEKGKEQDRFAESEGGFTPPGLMRKTVGLSHMREWYWALMDYGVFLKATVGNASRASRHYAKQSKFAGSRRQLRGEVLRHLRQNNYARQELAERINDDRFESVISDLTAEGLVSEHSDHIRLG